VLFRSKTHPAFSKENENLKKTLDMFVKRLREQDEITDVLVVENTLFRDALKMIATARIEEGVCTCDNGYTPMWVAKHVLEDVKP
jgi:hypothetical protein